MAAKKVILRKKIGEVLYDLLPKTSFAQVINGDNKTLDAVVAELTASITGVSSKFDNLIKDAPEAYDTLKEISDYIATHKDEYDALQALTGDKVTKEEGKGLSTNDFTNELKTKLDALYTKAQFDTKFSAIESSVEANTKAIETLNGDETTEGSIAKMIKDAGGETIEDLGNLKKAVETLNGDNATEGSVAKSLKDAIDPLTDTSTGILANAKKYTDDNSGKVTLSTTEPVGMTERDLWIYEIPEEEA